MRKSLILCVIAFTVCAVGAGDINKRQFWPSVAYGSMLIDGLTPFEVLDGLVGWWKFDDGSGTNAADSSGQSNDGTLVNSPSWVTGYSGGALEFNGTTQYVDSVGSTSDYSFIQNTGIFTISVWIKLDDVTSDDADVILGSSLTSNEKGFFFGVENRSVVSANNQLRFFISRGDGSPIITSYSDVDAITDTNWHHVAVTGDGTNITFYIDGVADTGTGTMGTKSTGNSERVLNIGRGNYSSTIIPFDGKIDSPQIFNRKLSAAEIATL